MRMSSRAHHTTRVAAIGLAVLLANVTAAAPENQPSRSDLAGQPATRAHEVACELTDRAGPRLSGGPGDAPARAWALEKMKALGLANVREEPMTVPHWERGPISVELVAPVKLPLIAAALGGSIATGPDGITAPVVRVVSIEALEALPADAVRGKIVFFDKPMPRLRDGFESYGKTVDVRKMGAIAAAKKGAVASLIRSVATSGARFPHTGAMQYQDDVPKIPAAALAVPDADALARWFARGEMPQVRLVLAATMHPDTVGGNVIGQVKGLDKPDEIVLLGAHLDSWDLGPGAVDDAAGVGIVLEVARLLAAHPARRTVRVVLFANEENGLGGAKAYAAAHAAELEKHQAAMEVDTGAGLAFRLQWLAGAAAAPHMQRLAKLLMPLGVEDAVRDPDAGGADLNPLTEVHVPKLELKQDARRYFDLHHSADDTCDKIDPAEIAQVTAAVATVVRFVADLPERLPPVPLPEK
jgi:carboxypeptidase Q